MKGNTALHEACHNGKLDVLKTLLDAGSDVKATTNEGETPLHIGVCQRERPRNEGETALCRSMHG